MASSLTSNRRPSVSKPYYSHIPPLLPWCGGLIAGIIFDDAYEVDLVASCFVLAASVALLAVRPRIAVATLLIATISGCAAGAALHTIIQRRVASNHLAGYVGNAPVVCRIQGRVATVPTNRSTVNPYFKRWLYSTERTTFELDIEAAEKQGNMCPASGHVWVSVNDSISDLAQGDEVELFGEIRRPRPPRNPGQFNWAKYAERRGIRLCMNCDQAENVEVISNRADQGVLRSSYWRRIAHQALFGRNIVVDDHATSLLETMILGRRGSIDEKIEKQFVDTGCAHYLAVSGLHVGILAGSVWFLLLRVAGLSRRPAALSVMVLVVAYAAVVDPRPSVWRAAVMTLCFGMAALLRRRQLPANTLSLAAIGILAAAPASVFDVGFVLSFTTVAGLITLYPVLIADGRSALQFGWRHRPWVTSIPDGLEALATPKLKGWKLWLVRQFASLSCVSVTAWFCSMPIIAYCFGRLAPWGWLNSIVSFPLVLLVMILGFARLAVGMIWQAPAGLLDYLLHGTSNWLIWLTDWLSSVPGTVVDVLPPPVPTLVAYYLLILIFACWRKGIVSRQKTFVLATIGLVTGMSWFLYRPFSPGLRVTTLAVGRGTACVIELPNGDVWLYDAGTSGSFEPGERIIVPYLRHRRIGRIEGIILSHQNLDHFGGVPSIITAMECGPVYLSQSFSELTGGKSPGGDLIEWLRTHNHPIEVVDTEHGIPFPEEIETKVLWPPAHLPQGLQANDMSIVIRLSFGQQAVLLTGDIEYAAQQRLMGNDDLSADVLMLPHHGAIEENTRAFVDATGASYLIRSSFVSNSESDRLLQIAGDRTLLNTADVGAIEVILDGHSVIAGQCGR